MGMGGVGNEGRQVRFVEAVGKEQFIKHMQFSLGDFLPFSKRHGVQGHND